MTSPILDPVELLLEANKTYETFRTIFDKYKADKKAFSGPIKGQIENTLNNAKISLDELQEICNKKILDMEIKDCSNSFRRVFTNIGLVIPDLYKYLEKDDISKFIRWTSRLILAIIEKEKSGP